uniref:Carboxylesterase 1C n=1 Tax=Aceria tosichella TaxID=561515 RepID=A0A6G1SDB1_9ACAR
MDLSIRLLVCMLVAGPLLVSPTVALEHIQHNAFQPTQNSTTAITTVQTSSGLLRGLETQPHHSGYQSVVKFLGVPYAQAPIGELRFKRPVELPASEANQTRDATRFGKTCPQHRHLTRFISPLLNLDQEHQISEDCLHLNLFVPSSAQPNGHQPKNPQLPVIVWIPGEGFDFADARQFDGSQLALRTQSIVVTVQYRVGALGLLDAPELGIQGNQAIHDQLAALRWIQKNIGAFGGQRDQVTVMGRFSGGMSISTMLTAPNQELVMTGENDRALFSRAALLSGVAVDDWIIVDNQRSKVSQLLKEAYARGLCQQQQQQQQDDLNCLQSMPVEQLLEISGYQWRLVRDNQLISQEGGPIEALRSGRRSLPKGVEAIMLGETGTEGTLCLYRHMLMANLNERAALIEENQLVSEHLNELIRDDLATYFQYNSSASSQALEMALDALVDTTIEKQHHNGQQQQQQTSDQLRQRYLDACSSYMVKSHNQRFKRHLQQANSAKLHHYQLNYKPSFSLAPDYIKTAAHGDDVPLIFGLVYNQPADSVNQADLAMTRKMLAYIGNFVHARQPVTTTTSKPIMGEEPQQRQGAVHLLDVSPNDLLELEAQTSIQHQAPASASRRQAPLAATTGNQVARLIIVEALPTAGGDEQDQSKQQQQQAANELRQRQMVSGADESLSGQLTRSQKLLELHREQMMLDESLWMQRRSAQLAGQVARSTSGANTNGNSGQQRTGTGSNTADSQLLVATAETSLATVLLLTASIVILALMSVCVVLSVLIVRNNALVAASHESGPMAGKRSHQFNNSSSTCNICDDSQGGSIDAVLNQQASAKKNEHAFCNVFAKLRNQHNNNNHHQTTTTAQQHNQQATAAVATGPAAAAATGQQRTGRSANGGGQHVIESLATVAQ